jgi:flagellar basal body-associated protein FliL
VKRLKIILPLVLLGGAFAAYTLFSDKPPPDPVVHGEVYVLPKEFVLNLRDGRFLKIGVGLVVEHGDPDLAAASTHAAPPEGYGPMPQEALVRDVITDHLTNRPAVALIDRQERNQIKREIASDLRKKTDVNVESVLFTDVAVQ